MADTEFLTSDALRKERWSVYFYMYARFHQYFSKFIGQRKTGKGIALDSSPNSIIQIKTDFQKEQGDKITFPMRAPLIGAGVTGDDDMEGNEESLSFYDWNIVLKQIKNAVRSKGRLSDKRPAFSVKKQARPALADWMAMKLDNYTACALAGIASSDGNVAVNNPSTYRKWCGGQSATGSAPGYAGTTDAGFTVGSDEYFGPLVIEWVKRFARAQEPIVRPIIIDGEEFYVMFIHPLQAKALKATTSWREGHERADVRGKNNALFTGALGIWDGVIMHTYQNVETRLGTATGTETTAYFESGDGVKDTCKVARALFCGAQAAVQAYGRLPTYTAKDFQYGDKWGVQIASQVAVSKPQFNSVDHGVVVVDTQYATDAS